MVYLTTDEIRRLFAAAHSRNRLHHLAMLVGFIHGLRVSETLAIQGRDIADGKLSVKRLKKSKATIHRLRIDADPLFDESPLIELAANSGRLFDWSRQYMDRLIKDYAALAAIHPDKAHYHVLKHSICIWLWGKTHDLNVIQDHVGHSATSSTLVYLRASAAEQAQDIITCAAI
jgi:integrase